MYHFETKEELTKYLAEEIINTAEAVEILGCTRQNIDDLVKRKKLVPIKVFPRDRIFFKSDVISRKDLSEVEKPN
ncbi:DNA-binding protein [Desulfosporosinus sp. SYSU MS00001]|uniref:DNA-binding protein n=1 Tax=Desulfosporosinus sp. SYSU MS00001 TaxID=3416284 RepID=UPI003CF4AC6C